MDMFSGLTSQMSNWMGKKQEGDNQKNEGDEGTPAVTSPSGDRPTELSKENAAPNDKKESPTKGAGRLEMLANVRSQVSHMTSWLGSSAKKETDGTGEGATTVPGEDQGEPKQESPASEKSVKGSPVEHEKEDDNSSATGGADSDQAGSEGSGSPAEDKEGQAAFGGAVKTKAVQGAKSIGSFFFSAVNKAGKTVSEASAKIKKTVEENSILGEFNKEQEAFMKEKEDKSGDAAVPPWVGYPNEESLKEEILSLSTDRRNFVRSPPAGVQYDFDYETSHPVAQATLAEDPNLEKMRFELVPKVVNEETFWRNYFYRVSLIRQSNELSSLAQEGGGGGGGVASHDSSRTGSMDAPDKEKEKPKEVEGSATTRADSPSHEFVSDDFQASSRDIEEVSEGMKKLGMDPKASEEEWEKELQAELQDYEVVQDGGNHPDYDWENRIQEMLDAEETDLK